MKTNCDIIQDLLPLYCDNVCSEESKHAVEDHIQECEQCRNDLMQMQKEVKEQAPKLDEKKVVKSAKSAWNKKKTIAFVAGCLAVLLIISVGIVAGLTFHIAYSVDGNDYEAMAKHAQKYRDYGELTIEQVAIRGNYLAALCKNEDGEWLMYEFERDGLFRNRWVVSGGKMGIQEGAIFGTINYASPMGEAVIIVFGGDIPDEVHSYKLEVGGITYICPIDGDTVLDIFVIPDENDISSTLHALDANGEEIPGYLD